MGLGITLISPTSRSPSKTSSSRSALFLQYFSESRFLTPHYQSVRPKPGENQLVESLQRSLVGDGKAQKDEEEEEDFITQLKDLPDPPPPPCPTPPVPSSCIFWKGKSGGSVARPGY